MPAQPFDNPFAGATTRELYGHKKKVYTLAWNNNGKKLASGSHDQTVRVWSIEPRTVAKAEKADIELKGHVQAVTAVTWNPSHSDRLVSTSNDKTVRFWDARSGKCSGTLATPSGNLNVTWSPDGSVVAVGGRDDSVLIIDARKYKILATHKGIGSEVNELRWSRNMKQFYAAAGGGGVEVFRYPGFEKLHTMRGHTSTVFSIALDPKERLLASGGADAVVGLWDLEAGACVRTFVSMDAPVRSVAFSPDGSHLAQAGDEVVTVIHVDTGAVLLSVANRAMVDCLAWNPRHKGLIAWSGPLHEDPRDPSGARDAATIVLLAPAPAT